MSDLFKLKMFAHLTKRTFLSPCSQVNLVTLEILAWRVLLASAAHLAERETTDPPVSLVSETGIRHTDIS